MKSNLRRWIFALLLSLTPVLAQTETSPEKGGVRFRTFGWMTAPDDLHYDSKGRDTKVSVFDSARSGFHELSKVKQLVFYRLLPGPEGKRMQEEAATVDISAAGPWPLLIFRADPDSPKRYQVVAVADDLKAFPFPSCQFVNMTKVDVYANYGDLQIRVAAEGIEMVDPRLKYATETETRYVRIGMKTQEGPRLLYSNNWVVRPTERTLVFVLPLNGRLQVMRITDDMALYVPPLLK
jgi:hypothetical protein